MLKKFELLLKLLISLINTNFKIEKKNFLYHLLIQIKILISQNLKNL